jgi:YHS domain-containing protein
MTHDPVCGMEIKDISKAEKIEYNGKTYYFCSTLCMVQFQNDPEKYIKPEGKKDDGDEHKHHHH